MLKYIPKWLLAFAAATYMVLPAWTIVQAADQFIEISLTAASSCTMEAPTKPSDGSEGSALTINIDGGTGLPIIDLKSRDLSIFCNTASNLTLASTNGRLTTATSATTGFDNFIDYTAEAVIPGTGSIASFDSSAAQTAEPVQYAPGTVSNSLRVKFTPIAGNALTVGDYADIFTISINPQ